MNTYGRSAAGMSRAPVRRRLRSAEPVRRRGVDPVDPMVDGPHDRRNGIRHRPVAPNRTATLPPIAHAPRPMGVMSRSDCPSCLVCMCAPCDRPRIINRGRSGPFFRPAAGRLPALGCGLIRAGDRIEAVDSITVNKYIAVMKAGAQPDLSLGDLVAEVQQTLRRLGIEDRGPDGRWPPFPTRAPCATTQHSDWWIARASWIARRGTAVGTSCSWRPSSGCSPRAPGSPTSSAAVPPIGCRAPGAPRHRRRGPSRGARANRLARSFRRAGSQDRGPVGLDR